MKGFVVSLCLFYLLGRISVHIVLNFDQKKRKEYMAVKNHSPHFDQISSAFIWLRVPLLL
jgi:hypothetical protein